LLAPKAKFPPVGRFREFIRMPADADAGQNWLHLSWRMTRHLETSKAVATESVKITGYRRLEAGCRQHQPF